MDPFARPDSADLGDMLADGAVAVLAERGLERFSIAAVARWVGWTPPVLYQRFPGPLGTRRRVLQVIVLVLGRRWLQWSCARLLLETPELRLPADELERRAVRLWAAVRELARGEQATGNPHPEEGLDRLREEEAAMVAAELGRWCGRRLAVADVIGVIALADGLRTELAAPIARVDLDTAQRILRGALDRLRDDDLSRA